MGIKQKLILPFLLFNSCFLFAADNDNEVPKRIINFDSSSWTKKMYKPFSQKKRQNWKYVGLQNNLIDFLPLTGGTLTGSLFGKNFTNNLSVAVDQPFGMYFSDDQSNEYAILRESGPWSYPYPDLRIAFHTGIKIGGHFSYGGTRFYNNSDMITQLMSVGDGDNNVRINYNLDVTNVIQSARYANKVSVAVDQPFGMYFSDDQSNEYAILRESGAWSYPYPDLRIAFHTGIKIGGHFNYGGTRFYNNSDMITQLMSIGDGDNNVRISNNLLLLAGSIGIGTTTPTEKLTVNGNIRAKKLIISQTNWSDYVFAKNYKLLSLAEVENYIKSNQHLPDVPSAKEVSVKGISVGDTQALLLKKIEELTLYVIAQEKKQQDLVYTIKLLENRLLAIEHKK